MKVGKTVKTKEADYAMEKVNNLTQVIPEIWMSKADGCDAKISRISELELDHQFKISGDLIEKDVGLGLRAPLCT